MEDMLKLEYFAIGIIILGILIGKTININILFLQKK